MPTHPNQHIPFHVPFLSGNEHKHLQEVIARRQFSDGGFFTENCESWLEQFTGAERVLLTSSCTHALEMCAILCDLQPGDEVIMPSFNFVSAANAFAMRGARLVYMDIRPDTMNLDANKLEEAITDRTRAIVVVHYGGVACDMDLVMKLARQRDIKVIEDAAHCIGAYYKGRHLGTIGDYGTISFHASKNIHCGEGGALLLNNPADIEQAEMIRDKGTNRKKFIRGEVSRYSWVTCGSSYRASELNTAFLWAQLPEVKEVNRDRKEVYNEYHQALSDLLEVDLSEIPDFSLPNAHIFYIKCRDRAYRNLIQVELEKRNIQAFFHYTPLHSSEAGKKYGRFSGEDLYTTLESERLLRLPLFYGFAEASRVSAAIKEILSQ